MSNQIKADIAAKHANLNHPFCCLLDRRKIDQGTASRLGQAEIQRDLGHGLRTGRPTLRQSAGRSDSAATCLELLSRRGRLAQRQKPPGNVFGFLPGHRAQSARKFINAPVLPETLAVAHLYKVRFLHDSFLEGIDKYGLRRKSESRWFCQVGAGIYKSIMVLRASTSVGSWSM